MEAPNLTNQHITFKGCVIRSAGIHNQCNMLHFEPIWGPHDGLHDTNDLSHWKRPKVRGVAVTGGCGVARQPNVVLGDDNCAFVAVVRLLPGPRLGVNGAAAESFNSLKM